MNHDIPYLCRQTAFYIPQEYNTEVSNLSNLSNEIEVDLSETIYKCVQFDIPPEQSNIPIISRSKTI